MDILTYTYIFILGMIFTSFFGVIAYRLPKNESINGRSYCPHCHQTIRWMDLIPILGYIINRGKCRSCKAPIPMIHPLSELLGGLLYLGVFLVYGWSMTFGVLVIFISVMLIESLSDMFHYIVIDRIWMIGTVLLIIYRIYEQTFFRYAFSSLLLFLLLFGISYLGEKLLKKEALGGGDIKLYVFIGFVLPWHLNLLSLFIASVIALIYHLIFMKKDQMVPLVPFLFIGSLVAFMVGQDLIDLYLSILGV